MLSISTCRSFARFCGTSEASVKTTRWKSFHVVALSVLTLLGSGAAYAQSLPSGWSDGDIGSVGLSGSATYSNNVFTVMGAGAQIYGTADAFHFVYQPLSGDGTIIARLISLQGGSGYVAPGVMVRVTLNAGSTNATTDDWPINSAIYFGYRASTGGSTSFPASVSKSLPYWVKVSRSGSTFSSYTSPDGVNWTQCGTGQTITMAQNVYIGLAVNSGSTTALATAVFDNVSVSSTSAPAPVISSVSPTTGLIGSQVVISGTGFGATQGNSVVLLNGTAVTINTWSATSIGITMPVGATSGPFVVSVAPSMNDSNPMIFKVLPSSWLDQDVGAVGLPGIAGYSNNVFTVKGSGTGASGTADAVHFAYQPLSGDGTIVARVVSSSGGQAGVMIRETLNANVTNAFDAYSSYMYFYYRATTGGSETYQGNTGIPGLPYWVKLVRAGNVFSAYISASGLVWTQLQSSQTITMAQNVYIGLAVSSQSNSSLATATFDNVSISSAASPAPAITALSATTGSVGALLGIQGSGFGSSQGGSFVTVNGVSAPVNTWSDGEIVITIPSGATTGLIVVTVAPSMNDSNPVQFQVTSQPLPAGWLDQDIGAVGGSSTYSSGTITVNGSPGTIGGTADGFHFADQPLSGDGTIVARVANLQGGSYPQAGAMIRETLSANSTNAFVYFQPNQANLYFRPTTGASTSSQWTSFSAPAYPYWVKLTRSGNSFTGYVSVDGVYWTQVGTTQTITMAQNVYVGLAVSTSGATGSFDNVSLSSASTPAPVITALSSSTGAIGSQLVITGSGFGASQGSSAVMLNNVAVPIVAWSDTSITITIPLGSVSGLLAVLVGPSMNGSNAVYFEVTSQPLPALWMDQDVGSVGVGSATYSTSNGIFTVKGAGGSIGSTADSFHFMYQPLPGDGTIIARVVSFQPLNYSQIGVMIRETLDPGARSVFVSFQPNQAYLYFRSTTGASTSNQATSFSAPNYPYWVKLTRSGNTFTGYVSVDGASWTQVGTAQTITMAQNVYTGLAVTLNSTTALFDNVSVNSAAAPAPIITGVSATTGSIGSQVVISGSHFGSSQGNSVVRLSDAPMTVNSWSDTSITITIATGAITGYLAVSVGPSMNGSNVVVFTVTSQPLPAGWLDSDIGSVGAAGSATYTNGTFTVKAKGSGIDGGSTSGSLTADGFHFVYQLFSGDGAIVARVSNIQGENPGILAGVMIRQTLDPGAVNAFVWYYPNLGYLGYRTSGGAAATVQNASFSAAYYPYWVKLARIGNTFRAYISQDGQNWTQVGTTQTISMTQPVDIGLALCNCASLNAATFDNVSVASGTMPTVSGVTPTFGTIGTSVTINGSHFGSSQGTSTVTFNGASASSITSWTDTQIVAIVPANASAGPVSVFVNSIQSNTDVGFTFYHPVITSVSPSTGQIGATVVVTGSGFGQYKLAGFDLLFNGVAAQIQGTGAFGYIAWSDTSITAWVPNTTSGPVTVTQNGIMSNGVQFNVEPLTVTGISPSFGSAGSSVTISGTGFGSSQASGTVDFFGTSAAVQSWSDTQIVAIVPSGASSGSVDVTVGNITAYGPTFTMTRTFQLTDSKGNQSSYTSAMIGGLWVPTLGQGSGCSTCTQRGNISYAYDSSGHPLSRTDENGNTTTYTYDANGNVQTMTDPISSGNTATTTYTYNSLGEVLTTTDPMGNVM